MKYLFILLLVFGCSGATLEWDRNIETNVIGYKVYIGLNPRLYDSVLDVGNQIIVQIPTDPEVTTYFAVTAYDSDGLESDYSEEVFYISGTNTPPTNICNFVIFPLSRSHGSGIEIGTTTVNTDTNCIWEVINTKFWITILSPLTNSGAKTVTYRTDSNTGTDRSGSFFVAGTAFSVFQLGSPTNNVPPANIIPPILHSYVLDHIFYVYFNAQANVWYDVDYTTDFIIWWPFYTVKKATDSVVSLDFFMNDPKFFVRAGAHN